MGAIVKRYLSTILIKLPIEIDRHYNSLTSRVIYIKFTIEIVVSKIGK